MVLQPGECISPASRPPVTRLPVIGSRMASSIRKGEGGMAFPDDDFGNESVEGQSPYKPFLSVGSKRT